MNDAEPPDRAAEAGEPFVLDESFASAVLKNVFEIWFTPEIERRRAAKLIGDDFVLVAAQAIFPEEGLREIRLNDEIKGLMLIEAQRPVAKGDAVTVDDLAEPKSFELVDEELDCGHITVVRKKNGWMLVFNALAGRKKAANIVTRALEFLDAATSSRERNQSGPCIDNLFSACELLSKAELILHRIDAAGSKKHRSVHSAIHAWGRYGNVPSDFTAAMKRMWNLRSAARYDCTTGAEDMPTDEEFGAVRSFAEDLERRTEPKIKDSKT